MRSIKHLALALSIGALLAAPGCKKKDENKTDDQADQAGKTTDNPCAAKTDENPCAAKTDENPCAAKADENPCGGGAMMSKEEAADKGFAVMQAMSKVLEENKDDCAKMAAGIQKIADDNKDFISQAKSMKGNDEYKKFYEEKYGEKQKELQKSFGPAMAKCGSDEKVQAAMKSLSGEE